MEAIRQGDIPGVQLRVRQPLPVAAEVAWRWLVDPALLVRWLADTAVLDAAGRLELATRESAALRRELGRTRERRDPGAGVAVARWQLLFERLDDGWPAATLLTLELRATADGCELSVLQEAFQDLPLSRGLTIWEDYRRRWRGALARLAEAISAAG